MPNRLEVSTHKLEVSFEAAKRLIRSVYAAFCPRIEDFKQYLDWEKWWWKIQRDFIFKQLIWLVNPANYSDTDFEQYMDRLGIFITVVQEHSTLVKSPYFRLSQIESYEDYDPRFKIVIQRILQIEATTICLMETCK